MHQNLHFLLFVLASIWVTAESATTFSYNPLTRVATKETVECQKEGLMCNSCTEVSECIYIGGNSYVKESAYECKGSSCSSVTGNCSTVPNPTCDQNIIQYALKCNQIGLFPHPFNRCKYLMCLPGETEGTVNAVAKELTCEAGYAYDPYTTLCIEKLPDATCPLLILPCTVQSQRGGIPNNPHMYYICLKNDNLISLPQLFVCPRGQVYNETKRACEEVVHNTGLSAAGKCLARGFFYDPTNCFSYIECSATVDSAPIKRTCASKMYFDEKLAKCVDFTCAQVK